jgi:hypothetical protein
MFSMRPVAGWPATGHRFRGCIYAGPEPSGWRSNGRSRIQRGSGDPQRLMKIIVKKYTSAICSR